MNDLSALAGTFGCVLAFDSFKNCMSAAAACEAAAAGVRSGVPGARCVSVPVSDGGEGLLEVLTDSGVFTSTDLIKGPAKDAYFGELEAQLLMREGTAVIECARTVGLEIVQPRGLRFKDGTSFGLGMQIKAALDRGARKIVISLGGSATNDGGAGMAQALGVRFYDAAGSLLNTPVRVKDLGRIARADFSALDARVRRCAFEIPCDVENPLLGERGATAVFGPQKGGSASDLKDAEQGLAAYAKAMEQATGLKGAALQKGAGAAGGLGAGCLFTLKAALRPGIDTVLDLTGFDEAIKGADLVITGEGRSDFQSAQGKVPSGVIRRCVKAKIPCLVISGSLGEGAEDLEALGAAGIFSIQRGPLSLEESVKQAPQLLFSQCRALTRTVAAFLGKPAF